MSGPISTTTSSSHFWRSCLSPYRYFLTTPLCSFTDLMFLDAFLLWCSLKLNTHMRSSPYTCTQEFPKLSIGVVHQPFFPCGHLTWSNNFHPTPLRGLLLSLGCRQPMPTVTWYRGTPLLATRHQPMHLQRKVKYPTTISPTSMGTKQNQKKCKKTFLSPFLEPSLKRQAGMTTARVNDVTPDQAGGVAGSEPSGTVLSLETHPRPCSPIPWHPPWLIHTHLCPTLIMPIPTMH